MRARATSGTCPSRSTARASSPARRCSRRSSSASASTAFICRFGNVVGPRGTHGAILDFCKKLKAHPDYLDVLGDGRQAKPYLHVTDCVAGMLFVLDNATGREARHLQPRPARLDERHAHRRAVRRGVAEPGRADRVRHDAPRAGPATCPARSSSPTSSRRSASGCATPPTRPCARRRRGRARGLRRAGSERRHARRIPLDSREHGVLLRRAGEPGDPVASRASTCSPRAPARASSTSAAAAAPTPARSRSGARARASSAIEPSDQRGGARARACDEVFHGIAR